MNIPNQSNRSSPTALGYLSGRRSPLNAAAAPVRHPDLEVGQVRRGLDYSTSSYLPRSGKCRSHRLPPPLILSKTNNREQTTSPPFLPSYKFIILQSIFYSFNTN
ncbi:Uncharacterized protein HZ326_16391 [Fusarium oxysporum f. sp. albedinis]|nr:Uncharacterized protein HZ326_16391 [Fusarium oxysporum f. sp. albedinis]